MTDPLKKQLNSVKNKFEEAKLNTINVRNDIKGKVEILMKNSSHYGNAWLGNWAENQNFYYSDFNINSQEGINIDKKYLIQDLKNNTSININDLEKKITPISKIFFELKDFILAELSFIKGVEIFNTEIELLKQIEEFTWGMAVGEFIRSQRPKYAYVNDPTILNKGLEIPPHIALGDDLLFIFSLLTSYDNFEKLAHRLIRQLEIKSLTSAEEESGAVFQQQALKTIIEKFHSVATQLKNRYDNRPTIIIENEYDVQDLMNALLRINFEDVRKEEYTPSYAGGSTRIDFLLKREKILIEVKRTRSTLKDKEVGNQLIIDIAHYKSHPDCKHLICFVYDPENLIINPRGLEDDLNRSTNEEMIVEVFIRP